MPRGPSGRVVIDLDPEFKRELHSALVADGVTLKDWFTRQAEHYLAERSQPSFPHLRVAEDHTPYSTQPTDTPSES